VLVIQPHPVFSVHYSGPTLWIGLLISLWAFYFCLFLYHESISEKIIIFSWHLHERQLHCLCMIQKQRQRQVQQKYLLI